MGVSYVGLLLVVMLHVYNASCGVHVIGDENQIHPRNVPPLKEKHFIVSSIIGKPYLSRKESEHELQGNDRFEGFCKDLLDEIANELNITYEIQLASDGLYGSHNPNTNSWNGMIRDILEKKADLAIADLTITRERRSAVDFTTPFMTVGVSILYTKDTFTPSYIFMNDMFDNSNLWIGLGITYLVLFLLLAFASKYSPDSNQSKGVPNCMWMCLGGYMLNGSSKMPRPCSTKVIMAFWWFCAFVMVIAYTVSFSIALSATEKDEASNIRDVEDLAMSQITYGAVRGGATANFFKETENEMYKVMYSRMKSKGGSPMVRSNMEGIERVLASKGKYAFFGESSSIEYALNGNCHLTQVGGLLNNKGYAIAMSKGSPYQSVFNEAIFHLQETGTVETLRSKWWTMATPSSCDMSPFEGNYELATHYFCSLFIVLLIGAILTLLVALVEFIVSAKQTSAETEMPFTETVKSDMKLAIEKNRNPAV